MTNWKTLDTKQAMDKQAKQHENTTSANVGAFVVPLGGGSGAALMRRGMVQPPAKTKKRAVPKK